MKETKPEVSKVVSLVKEWQKIYQVYIVPLTLSTLQTRTDTFANSVDPDEMAYNEPSHLDLHCLPFCSCFITNTLQNGHARIQRWMSPLQKLRGERINNCLFNFFLGTCWSYS